MQLKTHRGNVDIKEINTQGHGFDTYSLFVSLSTSIKISNMIYCISWKFAKHQKSKMEPSGPVTQQNDFNKC